MTFFGPDFLKARHGWAYDSWGGPGVFISLLIVLGLFVLLSMLQSLTGFAGYFLLFGNPFVNTPDVAVVQSNFAKATLTGMLPAGGLTAFVAWYTARQWRKGDGGLPLAFPHMGIGGWAAITIGFAIVVYALFVGTFAALGIDPQTYQPTAEGLNDSSSAAGLVEKVLADLADEPVLFAMALPGVTIAAPIAEELIFRGPLFAALVRSPVGKVGAVVLTSALWAMIHMTAPWLFVAIIFMMGIILGILLLRFGSLWVTMICHCLWNASSTLAIFGITQLPGAQ